MVTFLIPGILATLLFFRSPWAPTPQHHITSTIVAPAAANVVQPPPPSSPLSLLLNRQQRTIGLLHHHQHRIPLECPTKRGSLRSPLTTKPYIDLLLPLTDRRAISGECRISWYVELLG